MEINEELKNNILNYIYNLGEISIAEIFDEIIKNKAIKLDFKQPDPDNMLDVAEEEKVQTDCILMRNYLMGLNTLSEPEYYKYGFDEYGAKILYNDIEVKVGMTPYEAASYEDLESEISVTFFSEIDSLKRFQIRSNDFYNEKYSFEDCFKNLEEKIDEYDKKYEEEFMPYLSDLLLKMINKENFNLVKYNLTNEDKSFLRELMLTYKVPINIAFKDGYIFIICCTKLGTSYEEYVGKMFNIVEASLKIIERFINI